jgi:hypothetical protein
MAKLCFKLQKEKPKEVIIKSETRNSYIAKLIHPKEYHKKGYTRYRKKYWKKC